MMDPFHVGLLESSVTLSQLDSISTQDLLSNVFEDTPQQLKVEKPPEGDRYPSPLDPEEFHNTLKSRIPAKTQQNNNWGVTAYKSWRTWRQFREETQKDSMWPIPGLERGTLEELDYWLARFIYETRGKDGSPYTPSTLTNLATAIQRYMRQDLKRDVNFFKVDQPHFKTFRASLDNRRKELYSAGYGTELKQAYPITEDDEKCLWDSGVLSMDTGQGLLYCVYLYNCIVFGMRAYNEHEFLVAEQYTFGSDKGKPYIRFNGRLAQNVSASLSFKGTAKCVTHYADLDNPRCVVGIFRKYLSHIPSTGRFYRRPLAAPNGQIRYSTQVVGRDTLRCYIPNMFKQAGIVTTGHNITNHSGKVTCCTRFDSQSFDEQAIKSRIGHHSNSVQAYKRPSMDLQKSLSNVFHPPKPSKTPVTDTSPQLEAYPLPPMCPQLTVPGSAEKLDSESTLIMQIPQNITRVIIEKNDKKVTIEV